jgi:hypothetical protein
MDDRFCAHRGTYRVIYRIDDKARVVTVVDVSLVSGDATTHEDSVLSVAVDDVDAAYALAQATGLLPDYDKCQACIADVHSAFRSGS